MSWTGTPAIDVAAGVVAQLRGGRGGGHVGARAAPASATTSTPTAATGRPAGSPASSPGSRREHEAARRRDELAAALDGRARPDRPGPRGTPAATTRRDLVVVTKLFPASDVDLLADLGVTDVGENRDQEAAAKCAEVRDRARLTVHFIGQLQSNKAASVARYADVVQSVDRPKVARALARGAEAAGRVLDVTLQVSLDEAEGRGGVAPDGVAALADLVAGEAALRLRGRHGRGAARGRPAAGVRPAPRGLGGAACVTTPTPAGCRRG